jgi:uncharacterized protein
MKIAVFADTHGNGKDLLDALAWCGRIDALIHLGDGVREAEEASHAAGIEFTGVRGNEDSASSLPRTRVAGPPQFPLLLMHGDALDLNPYDRAEKWETAYRGLAMAARMEDARGVLYGHTHRAELRVVEGILVCNPGDMYIGSQTPPSFAEIIDSGEAITVRLMEKRGALWMEVNRVTIAV